MGISNMNLPVEGEGYDGNGGDDETDLPCLDDLIEAFVVLSSPTCSGFGRRVQKVVVQAPYCHDSSKIRS